MDRRHRMFKHTVDCIGRLLAKNATDCGLRGRLLRAAGEKSSGT